MTVPAVIPPPAPLTPADCDLRSLDWFKFYHKRLRRSSWWKRASHLARSINVDLWAEAFEQVPAASLPADDFELAGFAGFGRDVDGFMRVKAEVMAPWTMCADGRWYHPTLAEVATEAWTQQNERRRREREKKRDQRAKTQGHADLSPGDTPEKTTGPDHRREEIRQEEEVLTGKDSGSGKVIGASDDPKPDAKDKAKRGTRIPFGWVASAADRAFAADKGFTPDEITQLEDEFYDYWKSVAGKNGVKLDWSATWRNSVRMKADRRGGRNGQRTGSDVRGGTAAGGGRREQVIGPMRDGVMAALGRRR